MLSSTDPSQPESAVRKTVASGFPIDDLQLGFGYHIHPAIISWPEIALRTSTCRSAWEFKVERQIHSCFPLKALIILSTSLPRF